LRSARRRVPSVAWSVRLATDRACAHDSWTRAADGWRDPDRPRSREPFAATRAPHRDGLPELCPLPAPYGLSEYRVSIEGPEGEERVAPTESRLGGVFARYRQTA